MLTVVLGMGVLTVATVLLVLFRARGDVPHPAMLTTWGKVFPMFCVTLVVFGIGLIVHGLSGYWA